MIACRQCPEHSASVCAKPQGDGHRFRAAPTECIHGRYRWAKRTGISHIYIYSPVDSAPSTCSYGKLTNENRRRKTRRRGGSLAGAPP